MKLNFKISTMAMAILLSLSMRTLTASEIEPQAEDDKNNGISTLIASEIESQIEENNNNIEYYDFNCTKAQALQFIVSDPVYISSINLYSNFNKFISYGVVTRALNTYLPSMTIEGEITSVDLVEHFSKEHILSYFKEQWKMRKLLAIGGK